MSVYIAAILVFLYYIAAIPVKFAVSLRFSEHPAFGAGASVFEGRYALNSARLRALGLKKHLPWKKTEMDLQKHAALTAAMRAGRHLLRHTKLEQLRAEGRISSPDAAHTALICGCAQSLEGALLPIVPPGAVQIHLTPDFYAGSSDVFLLGMVSVQAGHIMIAALIGAWNFIIRSISHGKASD
ncbi:MAG: DUF2953 domain-containing protein [Clostridia bacterium]|nr:DUF2953 domain-containing protein [Clostridia bacterium]